MTEPLIPGKRYRFTITATANEVGALCTGEPVPAHRYGYVMMGTDTVGSGTVELLPDPLPTTPGSVVRLDGSLYVRTEDPDDLPWLCVSGDVASWYADSDLPGAAVLFDAGVTP